MPDPTLTPLRDVVAPAMTFAIVNGQRVPLETGPDAAAALAGAAPRADGSKKGSGFLGMLRRPDGGVSSELSMGTTDIDGTEREIPLLVPTLTKAEVDYLLAAPPGDWQHPVMRRIVVKAIDFARSRRAEGKPYFAEAAESPLGDDWFDQWQPGGSSFQGPVLPRSDGDALRGMGLRPPVVRPAVGDPRTGPEVPPTILDKGMNFLRGVTGFGDQGPAGQTWTNAGALVGAAMPLAGIFREAKAGEALATDLSRIEVGDVAADLGAPAGTAAAHQPATGRVMLDRAAVAKLTPAKRAELVRHELAHKIETDTGLWQDTDTALWKLWESDRRHPIWDLMSERTGATKFTNNVSPEILAELYATDYPKGTFTVKDRPVPYASEGARGAGPSEHPIPPELMQVLDQVEAKLGIWGKKQARGTAAGPTTDAAAHLANAPVERINGRLFLSTRVPGGATPILGSEGALTTGLADAYRDPKLTKKFADRVRTSPMLTRREQAMNDEGVLDAFVDKAAQNTDALIAMQPEDVKERSGHWYRGGHQLSNEFAARVGVTGDQGVGVMATQSPSKEWPQNVSLAERLMRWWKHFGQTDEVLTLEMADQAAKTTLQSAREWAKTNHLDAEETAQHLAKAAEKIQTTYQHVGFPWSALPESQQARMVRAVSELRESQHYPIYSPEGTIIHPVALTAKGEPRTLVWQSYYNLENALSILHDGSDANISLRVGEGQKVRSFFNNLSVPEDVRSVTADTHNVGGANLRPMGGKAPEVKFVMAGPGSKPTGISGAHPLYRDATIQAAKGHGLIPNQAQSISWESIKGLFSPAQRRNTKFVEQAYKIWEEYSRGRIRLEEVHARIYDLAGGLAPPDWAATAHQGGTP
jgi:hypothetical protein